MTDGPDPTVPELVPARMVNEYAYCPRLFYLEWVERRFEHNADTVEGQYEHRTVQAATGRAPLPEEGELHRATALSLSSPALGLSAVVDVVEASGGAVMPVEVKKGTSPNIPEGAWEPERVQLCVQGLLLREAGYNCDRGALYFAGSRRRVEVEFDSELIARTLALVGELRLVAAADRAPPPLLDSPKCPRCALVGICLPDETNSLAGRTEMPLRRVLPRDPNSRPLYVTEQGVSVGLHERRVEVRRRDEPTLASVRLIDVSQLCLFGNAQPSSQLLRALFESEIPVLWFSYGGWLSGIGTGLPSKHVQLRRSQFGAEDESGLAISRRIVEGKIRNERTLLRRNGRPAPAKVVDSLRSLADQAANAPSVATLLGLEGAAARLYFSGFPTMLREDLSFPGAPFHFDGRGRRPPPDPINCLLSFVYALLVKDLVATTWAVGFDPYIGIFHRPRFGRPALALDLAEEFRPLVAESVVVNLVNNKEIRPSHFVVRAGGVALTADGRRTVIAAYERRLEAEIRHPTFKYRISYRRVLDVQARVLAACLLGEIPEYIAFTTR